MYIENIVNEYDLLVVDNSAGSSVVGWLYKYIDDLIIR